MDGGYITTTTKDGSGKLKSEGKTTFTADGNPATSETQTYKKDGTTAKEWTKTNFAAAHFEIDRATGSERIVTETHRGGSEGTLKSKGTTNFTADGNPASSDMKN